MRLDIGADGKIIGTRRVSPNGQVSGLSEFAGREVLVILPGTSEGGPTAPWSNSEEVVRMVGEQIRQAYDRYHALQELYATPWEATRSFMEGMFGGRVPDLVGEVDRWVKSQIDEEARRRTTGPAEAPAPSARTSGRKRP